MEKQRTLKKSAFLSGIALHTGARATLKINPAPENAGIIFCRADIPGKPMIPGIAKCVVDATRGTTIAVSREAIVYTVEHIMSALHACQVDNAIIEMDGAEAPIVDGSAKPYLDIILEAGIAEQNAPARYWTAKEAICLENGDTTLALFPSDELKISCLASFEGSPIDPQYLSITVDQKSFTNEIAPARTFVQFKDLEALIGMGLVKGGSLDAAAVIHDGAIISKEGLRFRDEIVRHKILDIIGDIFLCGCRVKANIIAIKPGHQRNVELANAMIAQIN